MRVLIATTIILLFTADSASAVDVPDEQTKIEALKLGYILNGNSMVRWGSIDLTTSLPEQKSIRTVPITPTEKKKDRR